MLEQALLSVIVPVYNVEPYIRRCLDSIIHQTYKHLEIILVDDGSTDNSGKICDTYVENDQRIKVIHKANGGNTSARKAGLLKASGEYATYVDSDDFIEQGMYECFMTRLLKTDSDIITGGKFRDYGTHTVLEPELLAPGLYQGNSLRDFCRKLIDTEHFFQYNISAHVTDKIYKTNILKKWQMQVPDAITIGEDAAVIYPLLFNATRVYVSGENYYHYCLRSDSIMGSKSRGYTDPVYIMLAYIREKLSELNTMEEFAEQFHLLEIYQLLLRNPSAVLNHKNNNLWPLGKLNKTDSIILYGAGKFGMALKSYLCDNGFKVIAWVDNASSIADTIKWETAKKLSFDKVIISSLIYETIRSIIKSLEKDGVKKEKIMFVEADILRIEKLED